jgi:hypothetical protein
LKKANYKVVGMSSSNKLQEITGYVQSGEDIELTNLLSQLNQNPSTIDSTFVDKLTKQKESVFSKVYGVLEKIAADDAQELQQSANSQQIQTVNEQMLQKYKSSAGVKNDQINLLKRQEQINEWEVNNKRETLFVYQQIFIILCASVVLVYLYRTDIIGIVPFLTIEFILVAIIVFTVTYRVQYTDGVRDKQFWNKRYFKKEEPVIVPIPDCEAISRVTDETMEETEAAFNKMDSYINSTDTNTN